MRERRTVDRVAPDPRNPVEVQIMGEGFLEVVNAVNISVKGVGVYLAHGVEARYIGSRVEIILVLPSCRPVFLRGIIRHLDGYAGDPCYIGVEFLRTPAKVEALLQRYVTAHRHREHIPPMSSVD